jgi:metal-sulfur cluster biosynthetic enzyme
VLWKNELFLAQGFGGEQLSEVEFEEIMNRNRTVSSSAISRAVSDAAAGDYASAIETLVTAISLIRQSRVANDDRCKVLITSLQVGCPTNLIDSNRIREILSKPNIDKKN